jgi:hypothetical protein
VVDGEWVRRYPQMNGIIACANCVATDKNYWSCEDQVTGGYVSGHIPSKSQPRERDFDHWSHDLAYGEPEAMVILYPWAGFIQGAEPWIRHLVMSPRTNATTRNWLHLNLAEWDSASAALRRSNQRALQGGREARSRCRGR